MLKSRSTTKAVREGMRQLFSTEELLTSVLRSKNVVDGKQLIDQDKLSRLEDMLFLSVHVPME